MRDDIHDWKHDIRARLSSLGMPAQDESDVVEEIGQHLEEQYAELAPRIGAAAARAQLMTQLNDPNFDIIARQRSTFVDHSIPVRPRRWSISTLLLDVRYALRSLRRSPGMVAAGVAALAMGIGLTAVMFSVLYGTLLRGMPFPHADRIAAAFYSDPTGEGATATVGEFIQLRARQHSFEVIGAYNMSTATVAGGAIPEHVRAAVVTVGVLEATSTPALIGRTFVASDNAPGAPPTVVLGFGIWRDQFGADSAAVGRVVRVDGVSRTVIGVMPDEFVFPVEGTRIWLPLTVDATLAPNAGDDVNVVGRLARRATYSAANAEFAVLSRQVRAGHAGAQTEFPMIVTPYIKAAIRSQVYTLLYAMLAAVFLVLLVACANVANLLLDRALSRMREIGIRTALGASRLAIIRQSLVESGILALLAAAVGSGLAQAGIAVFNRAFMELQPPFWTDIRLHPAVLLFVLLTAVAASLVSGVLPALQSARVDVSTVLKDESHTASTNRVGKLSRALVTIQIAMSAALLLTSGFMTKSIVKLRDVQPGFSTTELYTARVDAPPGDSAMQHQFLRSVDMALRGLPGARAAYIGSELPGTGWSRGRLMIEGRTYQRDEDLPTPRVLAVSPGFFPAFNVHLIQGRAILDGDNAGAPGVAVVSETFARGSFPGATNVVGKRIRFGGMNSRAQWLTIVGVMPTLYAVNLENPWPTEVLTAFWQQHRWSSASVAVRGGPEVASFRSMQQAIRPLNADVALYAAGSMESVLAKPMWPFHLFGTTFVVFGIVALLLGAIGLYAAMAFSVGRRTRELGIRMALGAASGDVIRMVCRQGARQVVLGVSIGFLFGAGVVRMIRQVLFDVHPGDATVFIVVATVLGAAGFAACIVPALRATRVDPTVALRAE